MHFATGAWVLELRQPCLFPERGTVCKRRRGSLCHHEGAAIPVETVIVTTLRNVIPRRDVYEATVACMDV